MVKPLVADPTITNIRMGAEHKPDNAGLAKRCADFESIFVRYMLKSMRAGMVGEGILGNSNESKIFNSMFDDQLAQNITDNGGLGMGKMLFEHLKDNESV